MSDTRRDTKAETGDAQMQVESEPCSAASVRSVRVVHGWSHRMASKRFGFLQRGEGTLQEMVTAPTTLAAWYNAKEARHCHGSTKT